MTTRARIVSFGTGGLEVGLSEDRLLEREENARRRRAMAGRRRGLS